MHLHGLSGLSSLNQYRLPGGASRLAALLVAYRIPDLRAPRALPDGRRAPASGTDSTRTA